MEKKDLYIFIGPPGSGKGTISERCIKQLGWKQLSTGALCRKHIADKTEIGKEIDDAIQSGKLVSDELVASMVKGWLESLQPENTIILDGFPRTVGQAQALSAFLTNNTECYTLNIVQFNVSDDTILDRLKDRLVCKNSDCQAIYSDRKDSPLASKEPYVCDKCSSELSKRSDDEVASVQERLKTYHIHEGNLVDFYATANQSITNVNADQAIDDVYRDFLKVVKGV